MVYYCKYWWYWYKIAIVAKSLEDQLTLSNVSNRDTVRAQIPYSSTVKLKEKMHLFSQKKFPISLSNNSTLSLSLSLSAVYPTKAYSLII